MLKFQTENYKLLSAGWFDRSKGVDNSSRTKDLAGPGHGQQQPQTPQQPAFQRPNATPAPQSNQDPLAGVANDVQKIFNDYRQKLGEDVRVKNWIDQIQKKVMENINSRRMTVNQPTGRFYDTAYGNG
jgi:hypothetical protein